MLHKVSALVGYHIVSTNGELGHVDDFLLDEDGREVRYLIVDTSNWIGGKSVVISASSVERIDSINKEIHVGLSRELVEAAPSTESADIDPAETLPAVWIL